MINKYLGKRIIVTRKNNRTETNFFIELVGRVGIVVGQENRFEDLAVGFLNPPFDMHTCRGLLPEKSGQYIPVGCVEILEDPLIVKDEEYEKLLI